MLLADEHGDVAVYGLPYLEPEVARYELGLTDARAATRRCSPRRWTGSGPTCSCARAPARSCWPTLSSAAAGRARASGTSASAASTSVPAAVFDGVDYVALGHLHRPQTLTPRLRYSGSPLAYSFSEAGPAEAAWLVELDAAGLAEVRPVPLPTPRPLTVLTGALADLLADPAHAGVEEHFVSVRLTDPVRPADPMRRLQARFPHCVHLEWAGAAARRRRRAATRSGCAAAATSRSPASSCSHVRGRAGRPRPSAALLGRALAAAARAEAAP